ncbi:MAG: MFS transporter [Acidimicrobiales bacterium]
MSTKAPAHSRRPQGYIAVRLRSVARPGWSSRNFDLLFAARVMMSASRALAGVVTPIYLALQGYSAFELAEYIMVVALASAVLSAGIGLASDEIGRRPFLVVVPLFAAGAGLVFAFSDWTPLLFVFGALGSFGRGAGAGAGAVGPYQPAESAFVSEAVVARHRNAAFGRLAFASSLGATVGSLLTLLVTAGHVHGLRAMADYRAVFISIALLSTISSLVALGLAEPGGPRRHNRPPEAEAGSLPARGGGPEARVRARWSVRWPRRSRWLLYRLLVTNTVNGIAVGMFGPFITYWFFRRFGAGPSKVGVLFAVINVATMVSSLSAAGLARRWGTVRTVTAVRAAQAVLLVPMVLSPTFAWAGAIYLLRMVVQRVGLPLRQSYAIGLADPGERGAVAALSNVPSQLAMSASPLLSGYLLEEVSLAAPFEISAFLQLASATTFWVFFHRHPPEEERTVEPGLLGVAEDDVVT